MGEEQNNLHLSGRAGLKPNQCRKVHRRRKILLNHDARCYHDVMERFKKLIYDVKNNEKLHGDNYIDAANQLLHSQLEELQGLSSPVIGQNLSFEKFDWTLWYVGYAYY